MIRFYIAPSELWRRVDAEHSTWSTRAARNTVALQALRHWDSSLGGGDWSDIKRVYMRLQHRKCGFCERRLSDERYEWDVEHFRPKDGVTDIEPIHDAAGTPLPTGGSESDVYYWLAHEPFNYLASCKPCNSRYKANFFPIARSRGSDPSSPKQLRTIESPYLLYPIGAVDVPPETILTFHGPTAIPVDTAQPDSRARAQVTIEVLALNTREDLLEDRQFAIASLWAWLHRLSAGNEGTQQFIDAERIVRGLLQLKQPHVACLRAFTRLFFRDPIAATQLGTAAVDAVTASDGDGDDDLLDRIRAGHV